MNNNIENQTSKYNIRYQRRRRWYKVLSFLSAVVVFVTTYAMIIPAITWERTLICEKSEHIHSSSCYTVNADGEAVLTCRTEEHIHGDECFDAPPAAENDFICGMDEHQHTDECYFSDGSLKCTVPEHIHSDECIAEAAKLRDETITQCEELIRNLDTDDVTSVSETFDSLNELYQPADNAYYGEKSISETEYNSICRVIDDYSETIDVLIGSSALGRINLLEDSPEDAPPVDFAGEYGGHDANDWQIVSGEEGTVGYQTIYDEATHRPVLRLKKSVLPAGTENEFYICLTVEPVYTRDLKEMISGFNMVLCNSKNTKSIDFRFDVNPDSEYHKTASQVISGTGISHASFLVDQSLISNNALPSWASDAPTKLRYVENVEMQIPDPTNSSSYITVRKEEMHSAFALSSFGSSGTILYCVPVLNSNGTTTYTCYKTSAIVRHDDKTKTLYIPLKVYTDMADHGADLMQWLDPYSTVSFTESTMGEKMGDGTTIKTLTDYMGDYINDIQLIKCSGSAEIDTVNNAINWSLANVKPYKDVKNNNPNTAYEYLAGDTDSNGNIIREYYARINAYQLIYKVKLDTSKQGFESCQLNNNSTDFNSVTYQTNDRGKNKTSIQYKLAEDNSTIYTADFDSPIVRGALYSFSTNIVDVDTTDPLPDAKFELVNSSGEIVYVSGSDGNYTFTADPAQSKDIISNASGEVNISGLPSDAYTLRETSPPSGYTFIDEDKDDKDDDSVSTNSLSYTVNQEFSAGVFVIKNKKVPSYSLELLKRSDSGNGSVPLANVEFELYKGTELICTLNTNNNGIAVLPETIRLNCGTDYTLVETKPPNNYLPPSDSLRFNVDESMAVTTDTDAVSGYTDIAVNNELLHVTVINAPAVELPSTGGNGNTLIYTSGFLLLFADAILHYYIRIKRRQGGE